MRVELHDVSNIFYSIHSSNGEVIAQWFKEYLPQIMHSGTYNQPWRIFIWPSNESEQSHLGKRQIQVSLISSKDFAELEDMFREAKERAERRERRISQ